MLWHGGFNTSPSTLSGAPHWTWSAIADWVNAWTTELQAKELQAGVSGIKPILYMTRTYAAGLAPYLASNNNYELWVAADTDSPSPVTPQNYTIPGTSYSWSPSIWPWVVEQYNTEPVHSPPGDWDALNPALSGLDALRIGQSANVVLNVSPPSLTLPTTTEGTTGATTSFTLSGRGLGDYARSHSTTPARIVAIPPPIVASPSLVGSTFSVSVSTMPGGNYTLEFKNSFTDTNWTTAQTSLGTGGTITLTDDSATNAMRFYRVMTR